MGESISDILRRLSGILHWLGKYYEANELGLLALILTNFPDAKSLADFLAALPDKKEGKNEET